MGLLLDTHALLWFLVEHHALGPLARDLISDPANDVFVSVASLWEIAVKVRAGKLAADVEEVVSAAEFAGFETLDIRPAHLSVLARLPMHHRDPFDHLLIAQAIAADLTFMTEDRHASLYPVRHVRCSDLPPG